VTGGLSFAVVGTGRVAAALARRLVEAGRDFVGVVGRRPAAVVSCLEFVGAGRRLGLGALTNADLVVLAVDDCAVGSVQRDSARGGGVRRGSIWLHTSGRHDLGILDGVAGSDGALRGSLHPVCPIPDRDQGYRRMAGAPAVLQGDDGTREALVGLARDAGMAPVWMEHGDRVLYHAACALAANGLTALHDLVASMMTTAGVPGAAAADLPRTLMASALDAVAEQGSLAALSGPAVRGDVGTIADHLQRLAQRRPEALTAYRALMGRAAQMAMRRGDLDAHRYSTLAAELQFAAARRRGQGDG